MGGPSDPPIAPAIVAGGLAFSASLYPLPDQSKLLELNPPKRELSVLPKVVDIKVLNNKFPDLPMLELPDLVNLVELLNHNFPDFPTDALLDLVKTYGLPDLVTSLESLTHSFPGFLRWRGWRVAGCPHGCVAGLGDVA